MHKDYIGFVHADKNGHSNGAGYFSLEDYVKSKINDITFSKFLGINFNINKEGEFTSYAIVKDENQKIKKYELPELKEEILKEAFDGLSIMVYDKNVTPIKKLEEPHILETLPIK